jgi:hypothetical protein
MNSFGTMAEEVNLD